MHGVYLGGVFWAIRHGMPAGLSALIVGLQPLITAVLAGTFLGEKILPRHWIGLAAGFAGVVIVLAPKIGDLGGGVTAATLAACLIAVLGMSAGTIWQKRFASGGNLIAGTCWQYAGAALVMLVASLAFETQQFQLTGELVFAMAWLVLVLSIGAIFLLMMMIRDGEMSKVASLFYLVPATTAVIAWVAVRRRPVDRADRRHGACDLRRRAGHFARSGRHPCRMSRVSSIRGRAPRNSG